VYTIPVTRQVEQQEKADGEDEDNVSRTEGNGTLGEIVKVKKLLGANMFLDSGATESNYVRQDVISTLLRTHKNK
jgi:hypothetical protein